MQQQQQLSQKEAKRWALNNKERRGKKKDYGFFFFVFFFCCSKREFIRSLSLLGWVEYSPVRNALLGSAVTFQRKHLGFSIELLLLLLNCQRRQQYDHQHLRNPACSRCSRKHQLCSNLITNMVMSAGYIPARPGCIYAPPDSNHNIQLNSSSNITSCPARQHLLDDWMCAKA